MTLPADEELVVQALCKALPDAKLSRMPRHPLRRDILLAIICLDLKRRYAYSELELNEYLTSALSRLDAEVDHVTCRRYMVDLGFVKRDRAGSRYLLNFPKLESTLTDAALENGHQLLERAIDIQAEKLASRIARRKARTRG